MATYLDIETVMQVVAKYYNIPISHFMFHRTRRFRELIEPRQVAQYMAKQYTNQSLKKIGEMIGMKDHATILNSCKKVENYYDTEKAFREKIDEISNELYGLLKQKEKEEKICHTKNSETPAFHGIPFRCPLINYLARGGKWCANSTTPTYGARPARLMQPITRFARSVNGGASSQFRGRSQITLSPLTPRIHGIHRGDYMVNRLIQLICSASASPAMPANPQKNESHELETE